MKEKDTFIFHISWADALMECPEKTRHEVYDAMIKYAKTGLLPELSPLAKMAFSFIKEDMDYDAKKWDETIKARREAGKKGAMSRWQMMAKVAKDGKAIKPMANDGKGSTAIQTMAKMANDGKNGSYVNVDDNDNGSSKEDIVIIKEKPKKEKAFEGYSEDWIKLFNEWLEYKAAKKQGYKTEKSLRAMADQLYKLASGDIETARLIVNQSLASNWNGLFPLKTVKPSESDHYKGDDTIGKVFERRGID